MPADTSTLVRGVIDRFGGTVALADHLGLPRKPDGLARVRRWVERGRIPVEMFMPLLDVAEKTGVQLTMQELVEIAAAKRAA